MVTWKVVLVVIGIGILLIAIGMWLGYRYISEQDEILPNAQHKPSNMEPHSHLYTYQQKMC
ncbi:hypothetical protein J4G08_13415 [Candidatus Poribacteria bacterium]|nr:hypothetical protein [Candidatus Poribacteria bacterium]